MAESKTRMDHEQLLVKTDEILEGLHRVAANLGAMEYFMGEKAEPDILLQDVHTWLGDMRDRLDAVADLITELRAA